MYRKADSSPTPPENFELPFEGKLSRDHRWVIMANLIPWEEFEGEYAKNFASDLGAPALPFRVALGSLIIKEKLGISDRETVEKIKENPYLQYFIGQIRYSQEAPYAPSLLVRFRERIPIEFVNQINQRMVQKMQSETEEEAKKKPLSRKGKHLRKVQSRKINPGCHLCPRRYKLSQGLESLKSS